MLAQTRFAHVTSPVLHSTKQPTDDSAVFGYSTTPFDPRVTDTHTHSSWSKFLQTLTRTCTATPELVLLRSTCSMLNVQDMSEPADALHRGSEVVYARSDADGKALFKAREAGAESAEARSSQQPTRGSQHSDISPTSHS